MIKFDLVSFKYGRKTVIRDLSFTAEPGECTVIAGVNGIGKSTVLALAAGALKPCSGTVNVSGPVGYAPQQTALFEDLTVRDNLKFFASLRGVPVPESTFLPIGEVMSKKLGKLSGGMQKRVSLVCAELGEPDILLLDEPCTGLDLATKQLLFRQVEIWKQQGRCILYVAHDTDEISAVCTRLALLSDTGITVKEPGELGDIAALLTAKA